MAAGTTTIVTPASDARVSPNGRLEIVPAAVTALDGATLTAFPAGVDAVLMRFTCKAFRPAWPGKANILARARSVNDGHLFVFAEVQVEDPAGRYLGRGVLAFDDPTGRARTPPLPPPTLNRIGEPAYETPDPHWRRFASAPFVDLLECEDGPIVLREIADGSVTTPAVATCGLEIDHLERGHVRQSINTRARVQPVRRDIRDAAPGPGTHVPTTLGSAFMAPMPRGEARAQCTPRRRIESAHRLQERNVTLIP